MDTCFLTEKLFSPAETTSLLFRETGNLTLIKVKSQSQFPKVKSFSLEYGELVSTKVAYLQIQLLESSVVFKPKLFASPASLTVLVLWPNMKI